MSDATVDMSLQESCRDAARHMSVEVALLAAKTDGLQVENAKLRQAVARMWPMATGMKRCTFADRLELRAEIDELGIEVE